VSLSITTLARSNITSGAIPAADPTTAPTPAAHGEAAGLVALAWMAATLVVCTSAIASNNSFCQASIAEFMLLNLLALFDLLQGLPAG
jgi:hypothetical protein